MLMVYSMLTSLLFMVNKSLFRCACANENQGEKQPSTPPPTNHNKQKEET